MLGLGASKGSTVGVDGVGPTPVVTTAETLSTVGTTTATLEGSYVDSGTASSVGFRFGSDPNNLATVNGTQDGSKNITANVTGLSDDTLHYYQAFAVNSNGPGYGALKQFTTDEAPTAVSSPFHSSYGETPIYNFEFNATNGIYDFESSFYSTSFSTISRVSSITDENGTTRQNVMKVQVSNPGNAGAIYCYSDNTELETTWTDENNNVYYKSYAVEMYLFVPSANSHVDGLGQFVYGSNATASFTSASVASSGMSVYGSSDVGSWKRVLYGTDEDFTTEFGLRTKGGGQVGSTYFGFGIGHIDQVAPGDIVYVSDIKIYSRETTVV